MIVQSFPVCKKYKAAKGENKGTKEQGNKGTGCPLGAQRNKGTTEQRNNGTTEQRNNGTTEQRNNGTTEQRNNGTTEQRNNGTREQRNNGTTEQRNNGTTEQRNNGTGGPLGAQKNKRTKVNFWFLLRPEGYQFLVHAPPVVSILPSTRPQNNRMGEVYARAAHTSQLRDVVTM
jgi:hypothetical protein